MIKKTFAALIATASLLSAGAALADKPGAGWITIEKAIDTAKTKAGYVEIYKIEADNDGYWEGEGHKSDGVVYEFRIDGASGNILRDQKD
ncbi:PepSY domain-containing protein [Pseudomonas shahriarae]|uniref:PepSY domain-containing protein n=1 Tax=Pseudomonas shahriarae TaxID=2745512 RepID=A0A9X4C110_9PSED|nr:MULTISPECIES: PepSY domain-containing protein [Pseudomonas]MBA4287791.1 PepSY domain-containing protein [Pseudomonas sp.]MBK3465633.1 PepSY domain-containing protein [Pseudomonas sp. MF6776]MDD1008106.1 PepSY domain-containing protein [Pseudomonas shahriarae]